MGNSSQAQSPIGGGLFHGGPAQGMTPKPTVSPFANSQSQPQSQNYPGQERRDDAREVPIGRRFGGGMLGAPIPSGGGNKIQSGK